MKRLALTELALRYPRLIIGIVVVVTALFALQFPKVHFDNDPENMLAANEPVRLRNRQIKDQFGLYDFVIVGIVNEADPNGVFNVGTLGRVHRLTEDLLSLHLTPEGVPAVRRDGEAVPLQLRPTGVWRRALAAAFGHDAADLFRDGENVIIGPEIISPSVVDNLKQAELGALRLAYLMETAPQTAAEAEQIRADALGNPLYRDTLVSADGRAVCLYLPIIDKSYSYNVANLVRVLTADWPQTDSVYITGLPVAEDTFGVEMLVQMASSAPLAGLAVFLLMLLFFRRLQLVMAPMLVAIVSIVCTMGLLIGRGYDVHIMSSMIAIFLMPIAVVDAVHILSEFFDSYHRYGDKGKTLTRTIGHLFMPMLYTSLTTMAGFASLAFTPIPPVQVFGLHVAFGVGLAWVLTMTLIPAYVMVFVSERSLAGLRRSADVAVTPSALTRALSRVGRLTGTHWRAILGAAAVILAISVVGISRIRINDNPVKWFTAGHPIRGADRVLNTHFGGTYTAYLRLQSAAPAAFDPAAPAAQLQQALSPALAALTPAARESFLDRLGAIVETARDPESFWSQLEGAAADVDAAHLAAWQQLADAVNYLDPDGLSMATIAAHLAAADDSARATLMASLAGRVETGDALLEAALRVCDQQLAAALVPAVRQQQIELSAPFAKRPDMLAYVEQLQVYLQSQPLIGKSNSAVDALKKAHYELTFEPAADSAANFSIPSSAAGVGQVFAQLEGMKKKDSLFHLVTRDYRTLNLWLQLKSGDNRDMSQVVKLVESYLATHPAPAPLLHDWGGLTYINVIWQERMVRGMLASLGSSFVVVMILMMVLFRSPLFGLLSMIPLTLTIAFIYGLIGLVGKDYDMPVAVLSSLTLGLSVDFAIHFLERAREVAKSFDGNWQQAAEAMFAEPATAISRNAIVIAIGFLPLLAAPLVPYRTVGFFLATIMAVSGVATLLILPALLTWLQRYAFRHSQPAAAGQSPENHN